METLTKTRPKVRAGLAVGVVVFVLLGAAIAVGSNLFSGGSLASTLPFIGCSDSDGGKNYSLQGLTKILFTRKTDVCSANVLTEYFCASRSRIGSVKYTCPSGSSCVKGACVTPQGVGLLTITKSSSSPTDSLIPAATNSVTLAVFDVTAKNEDIKIEKFYLTGEQVNNGGWDQIKKLYIYKDTTLLGQFLPTTTDGISRTLLVDLTNNPIIIPQGSTGVTLTFKADTPEVNYLAGTLASSGQGIRLKINSPSDISAIGVQSATILPDSNKVVTSASGDKNYIFRSVPVVTEFYGSSGIITPGAAVKELGRFKVASQGGDIGLYYVSFKLQKQGAVNISGFSVYSGGVSLATTLYPNASGVVGLIINSINTIPAGNLREFILKANIECYDSCATGTSDSFSIAMLGDTQFPNSLPSTIPGLDPYSNFGWTDFWLNPTLGANAPQATTTMAEWSNGYLVPLSSGGKMKPVSTPIVFTRQ